MLRIGIDAMGGDFAPSATVKGAIEALEAIADDTRIVLFGDKERIEAVLREENVSAKAFDIVHCSEVIEMQDHPAQTFAKKTDSSIVVGFNHLKEGAISGFASAGSTGAMMVGCMYTVKQIEGVIRPAISTIAPTANGKNMLFLDVGLNVDCKPEVLYQYAIIGSMYAQNVLKMPNPRVGLLNIGEEKEKGNIVTKAAHELMAAGDAPFNFVGNVEGKHFFQGDVADVVVCDGFVGNILLKTAESFYEIAQQRGINDAFFNDMNYEVVGGTPVLGINGVVIIGHGRSSATAIKHMILQTEATAKADLVTKLRQIFN